ncbi:MAG TPA: hypothetical protein PLY32_03740 [Salinivirgaceae bacterium]|nr:hypothetical protein [Salinivirgaceae bacterium]HQA76212.1 hypothetical protein [Salinivirgaceae bacterium]
MKKALKHIFLIVLLVCGAVFNAKSQVKTEREEKIDKYKFEKRIMGPKHKKSSVLEIMVDKYNNYFAATFRAEKISYTYLKIYKLYTWEELLSLRMNDNRIELYNSTFDAEGEYFYANTDVYRNRFKKINIKTKEVEEVNCNATPIGCQKIEPRQYTTESYTQNNHYIIYRPDKYLNSILILKSKDLIEAERARMPNFLLDEEEDAQLTEKELNMADPDQMPEDPEEMKKIEQALAEKKTSTTTPKGPINYVDIMLNKRTVDDLGRYKYVRYAEYEILINNWLSATFEFERNKTKSITISEEEFQTLLTTGSVEKGELRLVIPADVDK